MPFILLVATMTFPPTLNTDVANIFSLVEIVLHLPMKFPLVVVLGKVLDKKNVRHFLQS